VDCRFSARLSEARVDTCFVLSFYENLMANAVHFFHRFRCGIFIAYYVRALVSCFKLATVHIAEK
jgi:hypothetical protein